MNKKLVFVLVLVALVAITNAKPQDADPVHFVDGSGGINIVDKDQQINVVDGPSQAEADAYARSGGSE